LGLVSAMLPAGDFLDATSLASGRPLVPARSFARSGRGFNALVTKW
jgi:hypothetical protein